MIELFEIDLPGVAEQAMVLTMDITARIVIPNTPPFHSIHFVPSLLPPIASSFLHSLWVTLPNGMIFPSPN